MIFKDAPSALKEAFKKRHPCPFCLWLYQKNHFKTLVKQLARMDLGSIENTLAPDLCSFLIWRDSTSVSRSNTNKIKGGNLSSLWGDSMQRPRHRLHSIQNTSIKTPLQFPSCQMYIIYLPITDQLLMFAAAAHLSHPSSVEGLKNGASWEPVTGWEEDPWQ